MKQLTPGEDAAARRRADTSLRPDPMPRHWIVIIVLVSLFIALALVWAANAQIDELSRAEGRVIPSSKTQVVESAEAGVVAEILVRRGEHVRKGQQLVRLDDTTTTSSQGEIEAKVNALRATTARLRLEAAGAGADSFVCPDVLRQDVPVLCDNERDLMLARQKTLEQGKHVLTLRVEQKRRELNEALANRNRLQTALALAQQNIDLMTPLSEKNLVSQSDMIAARRDFSEVKGQVEALEETVAGLEAGLSEARLQVEQADLQFREDALSELTLRLAELNSSEQTLRGASDRVSRTDIRSPVDGIVNEIAINTIGAFVSPGDRLMDIVPVEDRLLVEAKLKPSDVAFVLPGQKATVKFTAYDFSVFGGLSGVVQNVSADSIVDPETRETYYLVLIETAESILRNGADSLPILPGMITSVEILTGKKTILQYLLKPINKARSEALRER